MDGCFYAKGMFRVAPPLELKKLEAILGVKKSLSKEQYLLDTQNRFPYPKNA